MLCLPRKLGCPKTLGGEKWIGKYLEENNLRKSSMEIQKCDQYFKFGPGQLYHSEEIISLLVCSKVLESNVLRNELIHCKMKVYIVKEANVPLLCGRNTLKDWGAVLDIKRQELLMEARGEKKLKVEQTDDGHLVVKLFKVGEWTTEEAVYFINGEEEEITLKQIKKGHENLAHKSEDQLLHAYKNAGKLTKKVREFIKTVINRCQVCNKYKKSLPKPKCNLPKVTDFNQIVTIDLKQFGTKYVLWCV